MRNSFRQVFRFIILTITSYLFISISYAVPSPTNLSDQLPPATAQVDLTQYAGKWYEIASVPTIFQKGCRCTTAEYKAMENYMAVKNTCVKNSSDIVTKLAKAYPISGAHNTRFKIEFFKPFKHDYWIYYVSQNYQYAIVGTPNKKRVWLLARQPVISAQQYQLLKNKIAAEGFSLKHLKDTDQSCQQMDS